MYIYTRYPKNIPQNPRIIILFCAISCCIIHILAEISDFYIYLKNCIDEHTPIKVYFLPEKKLLTNTSIIIHKKLLTYTTCDFKMWNKKLYFLPEEKDNISEGI